MERNSSFRRERSSTLRRASTCSVYSMRSEEHTSELQSPYDLVCRLLLETKITSTSVPRNTTNFGSPGFSHRWLFASGPLFMHFHLLAVTQGKPLSAAMETGRAKSDLVRV